MMRFIKLLKLPIKLNNQIGGNLLFEKFGNLIESQSEIAGIFSSSFDMALPKLTNFSIEQKTKIVK